MAELTPSQTVGPFFDIVLPFEAGGVLARPGSRGRPISIEGQVTDGAGAPVIDALIEIWQANAAGKYRHPDDTRDLPVDPAFDGFGRVTTDDHGRFEIQTVNPGPVPGPDGRPQAPHLAVGVFARGILTRLVTRIYFADEPATGSDAILDRVAASRRATLIAAGLGGGRYRFEIRLQGEGETVFFDV